MGESEDGYFKNYPKHVFLILANEFCERFSYYGMKAFLVLYLTDALMFDDNTATAIYHSFVVLCYFTPLLGAMIADGWLGKFRTILYVSLIYILGSIIMTVTAIPFNGSYVVWAPFIGLVLIAFGTGGIKPNVSAFGGDQFSPEQSRQKTSFFSLFYMSINIGSLLSTIITPLIRGYVYCFDDNCYSLAFGIPAILMIVSEIVFVIGSKWYTKIPPGESTLRNLFGCIGTAIGRRCHCCCAKKAEHSDDDDSSSDGGEEKTALTKKKSHWLDYAAPDYDEQFISDVKDVLRVAWLFLPLPVFWALFDQQGSRWTLQATQLNGDVGGFIVLPDMIQVLNPLLVVILVPLFESLIYPCLDKLRIPNRALQRMAVGMIFAATAFLLAGFLQMAIDQDFPPGIPAGQAKFQFVNPSHCKVTVKEGLTGQQYDVDPFKNTAYTNVAVGNVTFEVTWSDECAGLSSPYVDTFNQTFEANVAYQLFTDENDFSIHQFSQSVIEPTGGSQSTVRFYNALDQGANVSMSTVKSNQEKVPRELGMAYKQSVSEHEEIMLSNFYVHIKLPFGDGSEDNETVYNVSMDMNKEIYSENGAVYVVVLHYENKTTNAITFQQIMEIHPWTTSIFLQVPQYFIITTGEVLFSVTGLAFAYSQAAPSMKSILTAIWLMTVAIGNVVVVIVAETGSAMSQMAEFFLFSGLMYVTTVIFAIMTLFYTYVERNDWGARPMEEEVKVGGEDNEGMEMQDEKMKIDTHSDLDDTEKAKELAEKKEDKENEYELPEQDEDIKL